MKRIIPIVLLSVLAFITSCDNDEPKFSSSKIQNALFEMKGTYYGDMYVSYDGDKISDEKNWKVVSSDSLTVNMDLAPIALTVADESVASRLRDIGVVQVKAGYEFLQMGDTYSFALHPDDVVCLGGYGAPATVKIVFSQIFGGNADIRSNYLMFNLSPVELWIGDEKYEPSRKFVYHYEGTCE